MPPTCLAKIAGDKRWGTGGKMGGQVGGQGRVVNIYQGRLMRIGIYPEESRIEGSYYDGK